MLQSLSIRNFAIIDWLDIEFGKGLNVLTGETGAGKSIIMGALTVILGGRAGTDLVRAGCDRATIDAVFDVTASPALQDRVGELGFEIEDGRLFLSREIGTSGKSSARVMGRPAAAAQLREIGDGLVDLHGQHEHQSLLAVPRHLEIVDEWAGSTTLALRDAVAQGYARLRELERERASLETDARERARLIDLYRYQVQEIGEAALCPGEEEELRADARRLANAQRLAESASEAHSVLNGDNGGVVEALAQCARGLGDAAALDESLAPIAEAVSAAMYGIEEAARDLAGYEDSIEFNPERLAQIEERLELIAGLRRKYGDTIEEILAYGRKTAETLDSLTHSEERGRGLDTDIEKADALLDSLCRDLSGLRKASAGRFADAVAQELGDLAMEKTRFEVRIEQVEPTPKGTDHIEFVIAPNAGEPLRPLARIASGGEISRVMLAIKSAMARKEPLPTMVFDEIDVGVGGRTASVIGEKLSALSQNAQVLCITHLPQIASKADSHFYIVKRELDGRTTVGVNPLSNDERIEELARMLAGSQVTDAALQHARELLNCG